MHLIPLIPPEVDSSHDDPFWYGLDNFGYDDRSDDFDLESYGSYVYDAADDDDPFWDGLDDYWYYDDWVPSSPDDYPFDTRDRDAFDEIIDQHTRTDDDDDLDDFWDDHFWYDDRTFDDSYGYAFDEIIDQPTRTGDSSHSGWVPSSPDDYPFDTRDRDAFDEIIDQHTRTDDSEWDDWIDGVNPIEFD